MNSHKIMDKRNSGGKKGSGLVNFGSNPRRLIKKPKPAWNDNVADPERYKLNQEELLKRKELLVSKHNVLSENYKPPKERSILHKLKTPKKQSKSQPSSAQKKMDSLDLLTRDSSDEDENDGSLGSEDESDDDLDSFDRNLTAMKLQATSREDNNLSLSSEPRMRLESRTRLSNRTSTSNKQQSQRTSQSKRAVATSLVVTPDEKIEKTELTLIADEIQNLRQELKLYEELSGKKTILDAQELDEVFAIGEDESPVVNQKTVTRYLVQLVCQSMTYLLKAQVDKETMQAEVDLLRARVTELGDIVETRNHAAVSFTRYNQDLPPPPPPPEVAPIVSMVTPEARRQVIVSPSPAISIPRVSHSAPKSNTLVLPSLAQQAQQELLEKQSTLKAAFRGTSTTDFLFMPQRSSPATVITPQPQQVAAESLQAADLAAQTYDLYLKQRSEVRETGMGDSYDDMIERLSYKFTSNIKGGELSEQPPSLSPAPRVEGEGFSIVTPNTTGLPLPAKPSQHPNSGTSPTYLQQGLKKDIFSPSPVTKRVYDATLGSYEPIQQD